MSEKKSISLEDISESLSSLTALELASLSKMLQDKWGVSPVVASAGSAAAAAPVEEQDKFTVTLESSGDNKINVIKEVRAITSLGLKEAKDLVEGAPKVVKEGVSKSEAEDMKKKLESAGAKVKVS